MCLAHHATYVCMYVPTQLLESAAECPTLRHAIIMERAPTAAEVENARTKGVDLLGFADVEKRGAAAPVAHVRCVLLVGDYDFAAMADAKSHRLTRTALCYPLPATSQGLGSGHHLLHKRYHR